MINHPQVTADVQLEVSLEICTTGYKPTKTHRKGKSHQNLIVSEKNSVLLQVNTP